MSSPLRNTFYGVDGFDRTAALRITNLFLYAVGRQGQAPALRNTNFVYTVTKERCGIVPYDIPICFVRNTAVCRNAPYPTTNTSKFFALLQGKGAGVQWRLLINKLYKASVGEGLNALPFSFIYIIQYKSNPRAIFAGLYQYNSKFFDNPFRCELYGRGKSVAKYHQ